MQLFDRLAEQGHEEVVFCHDGASGLRAMIAVHSTRLGPALGGVRFRPYPTEEEALEDVLALSRAMTYKAAAAGLELGGGKAVILGDPNRVKSEALLRAYGRHVERLGGTYLTAEDVGTTQADMDLLREETSYVTGTSLALGGSGDPSAATAVGVLQAMLALATHLWGSPDLRGRRVVLSGVGKVGRALAGQLLDIGAVVSASDVNPAAARRAETLGATLVPPERAHAVECDIFSPCALGSAITVARIPEMRCQAVVGAANNQLAETECAVLLAKAGITYVPDFIANAGGIINLAEELDRGYRQDRALSRVRGILATTGDVLDTARREGATTTEIAERMAEQRLSGAGRMAPSGRARVDTAGG